MSTTGERLGNWEKAIRIIPFSGDEEKWNEWKSKFLVKAKSGGYKKVLLGEEEAPDEGTAGFDVDFLNDEEKRLYKANEDGFDALTLACEGVAHELIASARTSKHPDGDAREAWLMLSNTYEDDTMATRIALKARFDTCCMKDDTAHPKEWVTELEQLKRRLNTTFSYVLSDDDLIDHILMKLPKSYSEVVTSIATSKVKHSLPDVKQSVRAHYIRVIKDSETNESVFVHINNCLEEIKDNNLVSFEVEMGQKGPMAVQVKVVR